MHQAFVQNGQLPNSDAGVCKKPSDALKGVTLLSSYDVASTIITNTDFAENKID